MNYTRHFRSQIRHQTETKARARGHRWVNPMQNSVWSPLLTFLGGFSQCLTNQKSEGELKLDRFQVQIWLAFYWIRRLGSQRQDGVASSIGARLSTELNISLISFFSRKKKKMNKNNIGQVDVNSKAT